MLTPEEETFILTNAYVPEHIFPLIAGLCQGEPFLIDDYFLCYADGWVVLTGYPLQHPFALDHFENVLEKIKKNFKPERISLIAPELSRRWEAHCRQKDADYYYTVDTKPPVIGNAVRRNIKKASHRVTVEHAACMGEAHHELIEEFVQRINPPQRVKNLLLKMPRYVASTSQAIVLNAWSSTTKLAAFYVVDLAAKNFANYIIGSYSKKNYILGASDLLMAELFKLSQENNKAYIHLGLGVSSGIKRFKEKWGAKPTRRYHMCELVIKRPLIFKAIRSMIIKDSFKF